MQRSGQSAVRVCAERAPAAVLAPLLGGVDALGAAASLRLSPHQQDQYDQLAASAQREVGEEAFAAAWAEGRAMTRAGIVQAALASLEFSRSPAAIALLQAPTELRRSRGLLSTREYEVLEFVAEGLTNVEIAERLVISLSTARHHVTSLLNKLGAGNRTQAVAHARRQGLL